MLKAIGFIIILTIASYLLMDNLPQNTPKSYGYWALGILWSNLLPAYIYFTSTRSKEIFPLLGLVGAFIVMAYSLPVFFINTYNYQFGNLELIALQTAFWAYLLFYCFYYILEHNFKSIKVFNPINLQIDDPNIRNMAYLFICFWIISSLSDITTIKHLGNIGIYIYLGIFLILINKKIDIQFGEKLLFYIILTYESLQRFFDGLMSAFALLLLFMAIIDYYSTKKIKRIFIFVIIFLLFFLYFNPVKFEFRNAVWYADRSYSIYERFELINDMRNEKSTGNFAKSKDLDIEEKNSFFWRYSYQASALSLVLEKTPSVIPFWGGESYSIISKFVPRIFWPNKPKENMGYDFGVRYGVMDELNFNTSMNLPILAEMYMNYGFFGIIFGMFVLAFIYVLLNNYLNNLHLSDANRVFSVAMLFPLVIHESNFTMTFGNVPLLLITIYIIGKSFEMQSRKLQK